MRKYLSILAAAVLAMACKGTAVTDLTVDYMTTPLGIDNPAPCFGWKMLSDRYDVGQQSYRIVVSDPEGNTVYDSGETVSDISVGIPYDGDALKPCTRYEVDLLVTDNTGGVHRAGSYFETGLMDSGWDGAGWIGSGQPHFSKYRSKYTIDLDFNLPEGSSCANFVFGYRDDGNYVTASYVALPFPSFKISHVTDGVETVDFSRAFHPSAVFGDHHLRLDQVAVDYAKGYRTDIVFDGVKLNGRMVESRPYPEDVWKPFCRFNMVGFNQPEGSPAVFSNLTVSESTWNTVLYSSDESYAEAGGQMHVISPAEESGAPMLRKSFTSDERIESARMYVTSLGINELFVNGKRLSEDRFNPGSTDYRYRIFYNTYDLTPYLKEGDNAVCAQLGAGWYSDFTGFATAWQDQFGTELALKAKIVVTYADGTSDTYVTDGSWKAFNGGPVVSDSFQNGEDYDARREVEGWTEASFDDSLWQNAVAVEPVAAKNAEIQYYVGSPVSHVMTLDAVSVTEPQKGVFVYDMGQNMVGVPSITLSGREGQEITLRYGEMIYPEKVPEDPLPPLTAEVYAERRGMPYTENYRGALSTDHYICKGAKSETIEPHFTFHGYRYVAIYGLEKALPLKAVKGLVMNSVGDQTSGFETSDSNINRLYSNIVWGQRGNFLSIPTDCPQRDERMGWTGDAQVFVRTATYNMNVNPFFHRWFCSVRDAQGDDGNFCDYVPKVGVPPTGSTRGGGAMGWTETGIVIPWQIYLQYGDAGFLRENYGSMAAYMDYLEKRAVNFIQPGGGYGDWVAVEHTNSPLTNTAYFAYDAMLMEKMACALGKADDAAKYHALYENVKEAFNREFVGEGGVTKASDNVPPFVEWIAGGSDDSFIANTQTSYVVPLQADLFNERNKPLAVKNLVDDVVAHGYTLTTGFIGTPYINLVLSANGHDDVAYKLFEQKNYPSWIYPVLQGATTMWERWNSYTIKRGFGPVDMNSFNHYSFGAIQEWMMSYMLGIRPDEAAPGYRHFMLAPRPGGSFSYVKGHYDSVYGRIESSWKKTVDGYEYYFTVPANTFATLDLAVPQGGSLTFVEGATYARADGSGYILPSGKYVVLVR